MIVADQHKLETDSVQRMVSIRERAIRYNEERINVLADTATLLAGFMVNTFGEMTQNNATTALGPLAYAAYYMFTLLGICSATYVVLASTLLSVFGPGLALEGPQGSVLHAYAVMRNEKAQVYRSFVSLFVLFVCQTICSFFAQDADKETTFESSLGCLALIMYCIFVLRSVLGMFRRLFPEHVLFPAWSWSDCLPNCFRADHNEHNGTKSNRGSVGNRGSAGWRPTTALSAHQETGGDKGVKLLNDMQAHPDFTDLENRPTAVFSTGMFHVRGELMKRTTMLGNPLATATNNNWKKRYFMLEGTELRYWKSQEDFDLGKQPCKPDNPIDLHLYDVLVRPDDYDWGIVLEPLNKDTSSADRTWHLRCPTEHDRVVWAQALLAAALSAMEEPSE